MERLQIKECYIKIRSALFSWGSITFPQQNINQSEIKISYQKLSEELYASIILIKFVWEIQKNCNLSVRMAAMIYCKEF